MQALARRREQGRNYDTVSLVRGFSAAAGGMLTALARYYPDLLEADERRWGFLATAAGLYLASQATELTELDQRELPDHMAQGMASCRNFVPRAARGATDSLTLDWAVGCWILSGLFREEPQPAQAWMAAAIGDALAQTSRTLASITRLRPAAETAHPAAAGTR